MTHEVQIDRAALRSMNRMDPQAKRRVFAAIEALAEDPRPPKAKPLTGPLAGHMRLRVTGPGGEYRVIYTIDDAVLTVTVVAATSREDAY